MNNSSIKKSHKRILIVLSLAIITAGGVFMFNMLGKSQEERRNREYEVSLVETLKGSYEGIEKIKFSNANYTNPPGSWTCVVELFFNDKSIKYKIKGTIYQFTPTTICSIFNNTKKTTSFRKSSLFDYRFLP